MGTYKETYAESCGYSKLNWFKELDLLIAGKPSKYSYTELTSRANSWTTCACGNQCSIIPRNSSNGEPKDSILKRLGYLFNNQVESEQWEDARDTLVNIEHRSAILIEEISKGNREKAKVELQQIDKQLLEFSTNLSQLLNRKIELTNLLEQ